MANNSASTLLTKNNRKNDTVNYNLDHLYCHTNDTNYIRANSGTDAVAVLKEIKQLKAMLLLHLDLIQEQSDQLMTKDKLLANLRKENEMLKSKLERRLSNKQNRKENNSPIPVVVAGGGAGGAGNCLDMTIDDSTIEHHRIKGETVKNFSAKLLTNCSLKLNLIEESIEKYKASDEEPQQQQKDSSKAPPTTVKTTTESTTAITKLSIPTTNSSIVTLKTKQDSLLKSITTTTKLPPLIKIPTTILTTITPVSSIKPTTTTSNVNQNNVILSSDLVGAILGENSSIIGESNGKYINKIILQRVQSPTTMIANDTNADHNNQMIIKSELDHDELRSFIQNSEIIIDDGDMDVSAEKHPMKLENGILVTDSSDCNKNKELFDNNIASRSSIDSNQPLDDVNIRKRRHFERTNSRMDDEDEDIYADSTSSTKRSYKRGFMTTPHMYLSREWQMDEIEADVNKQISDVGDEKIIVDVVNLEIPRWTIRESAGLYSIEGTEDLSDEVFLKRHARLEHNEKKRKKWDVQRIREQRTIERLKRRHCKDEIVDNGQKTSEELSTFYPLAENIKFVQITDNLPVQAFGESIPLIPSQDFSLPWNHRSSFQKQTTDKLSTLLTTTKQTQIVFAKKNRIKRHYTVSQSSTTTITTPTKVKSIKRLTGNRR